MANITRKSHDPIWHLQAGIAAIIGLQLLTANSFLPSNKAVLIACELFLIASLSLVTPRAYHHVSTTRRLIALVMIGVVTAVNIFSLVLLLDTLIVGTNELSGRALLINAGTIYVTNIFLFALWYWEMDGGGPDRRTNHATPRLDFLFPQMVHTRFAGKTWLPGFTDYLYLSVTNVVNFAAADTLPLSHRAKIMMMTQSLVALVTIALVVSRAISIMQ